MRLARLRHQMLIAMGCLPGCWTSATTSTPVTTPPVVDVPKPPVAEFDPDRCARDTIPEMVCGLRNDRASKCGPNADSLASIDESTLFVTPAVMRPDAFKNFEFDLNATRSYKDRLDSDENDGNNGCCYSRCTPLVVGTAGPVTPQPGYYIDEKCFPPPPGGTSQPAADNKACPIGVELNSTLRPYASGDAESCCYTTLEHQRHIIRGRALRINGEPAGAGIAATPAWCDGACPNLELDPAVRTQLATAWLDAARMEHASIAAFSVLSLRLLALGAPPELLAATHAAALDEIEHARLAFELASAYAGTPLGPDRFAAAATAPVAIELEALAIETLLDGCLNETVAALEAEVAGDQARDPVVAAVLAKIAADEARHAELAFAILAWCVRTRPAMVGALRDAFDRELAAPAPAVTRPALAEHGVLGDVAIAALRAQVARDVVEPCLRALR